jgi:hypothetical protein
MPLEQAARASMLLLAILVVVLVCLGFRRDPSKLMAQQFVDALGARSDAQAITLLAPQAEVFLHGATTPLSREGFGAYLSNLHRGGWRFRAVSRVFATPGGAGWLLHISHPSVEDPRVINEPQLWMQAVIGDGGITRLWVHFLPESLARLGTDQESYQHAAALRALPLPAGWSGGAAAIVAAAEASDPEGAETFLFLGSGSLVGIAGLVAAIRSAVRSPHRIVQGRGALLAGLLEAQTQIGGGRGSKSA